MKCSLLLLLLICSSCTSIKFMQIESDYVQDLKGNVKEVQYNEIVYSPLRKDSIQEGQKLFFTYDKNKRLITQKEVSKKGAALYQYHYNKNGLLAYETSGINNPVVETRYVYDTRNNQIIAYQSFSQETLTSTKSIQYDKRNNPIAQQLVFAPRSRSNASSKFANDYKHKTVTTTTFDQDHKASDFRAKTVHNKKGNIIRAEINWTSTYRTTLLFEYDKNGNLTKRTTYEADGSLKSTVSRDNTYDEQGNISVRNHYENGKLSKKSIYTITYF